MPAGRSGTWSRPSGAFLIAASILPFLVNLVATFINGEQRGRRSVGGQHAGVGDHLAAASLQLRQCCRRFAASGRSSTCGTSTTWSTLPPSRCPSCHRPMTRRTWPASRAREGSHERRRPDLRERRHGLEPDGQPASRGGHANAAGRHAPVHRQRGDVLRRPVRRLLQLARRLRGRMGPGPAGRAAGDHADRAADHHHPAHQQPDDAFRGVGHPARRSARHALLDVRHPGPGRRAS